MLSGTSSDLDTHTHTHAHTNARTHARTHTRTHARARTHTHTNIHSEIRHYLSEDVTPKLLCVFVLSELDYYVSLSAGCLKHFVFFTPEDLEQSRQTRLLNTQNYPLTTMLHSFHWLPIEPSIEYWLSLLCFKIVSHQAPIYLS